MEIHQLSTQEGHWPTDLVLTYPWKEMNQSSVSQIVVILVSDTITSVNTQQAP